MSSFHVPRDYNAAHDLIEGNLLAGRAGKVAFIDDAGQCTFGELAERASRFGSGLQAMGLGMEDRVLLALTDSIDFPTAFLGAIKAGIIPVVVNALLTPRDYEHMLADSRARALIVSEQLVPQFGTFVGRLPFLRHVIVSGRRAQGRTTLDEVMAAGSPALDTAPTTSDDACCWFYSSGSTGAPKAVVHVHSSMAFAAELYGKAVLGVTDQDVLFSSAKLSFVYGLGNALTFTLGRRGDRHIDGRAPDADIGIQATGREEADHLLRRADAIRFDARQPRAAEQERSRLACVRVRRGGAAGGTRQALERKNGCRHPGRNRVDRDDAHVHQRAARRSALWGDG